MSGMKSGKQCDVPGVTASNSEWYYTRLLEESIR